jgi:hypothetical protein
MKYLKKFNEELRPQTYLSAAKGREAEAVLKDELHGEGSGRESRESAKKLRSWAREMEKKEEMIKWKDRIQDYAQFGTFKMTIKNPETGETLTGDFHLDISFDELAFSDYPEGGISFFLGLIPTSEDLIHQYMELCPDYDFGNGFFWGKIFNLEFEIVDDMVQFTKWNFWDYDEDMYGKITFANRVSANKFKNLLIQFFTNKDLGYPSGYTDADDIYEKLETCILAENSFSSDYGFKLEDAADYIRTISPNLLHYSL